MISTDVTASLQGSVQTMHILFGGELICNYEEFLKVADRFAWVDRRDIITKILHLRGVTDQGKKSIIAIYEDRQVIREFVNVDEYFKPLLTQ